MENGGKKGKEKVAMLDSRLSKKEGTRIQTERREEKGNWLGGKDKEAGGNVIREE